MEYKVIEKDYTIPNSHRAFDGHFPHSPIFPAVAQIDLVTVLLREHFTKPVKSRAVRRAKFRAILGPETAVHLVITLKEEGEARWTLSGPGTVYSMGDISYSLGT
ncbi:MAG: hypothetical protein H7249_05530 [Chitinophagaceae bacterium]|nr:hypothetical protein [Oligoflexus sp.]